MIRWLVRSTAQCAPPASSAAASSMRRASRAPAGSRRTAASAMRGAPAMRNGVSAMVMMLAARNSWYWSRSNSSNLTPALASTNENSPT